MKKSFLTSWLPSVLAAFLFTSAASAQWVEESYTIKPGWNAIWLSQDCSYAPIKDVLTNPDISDVWRWNPDGSTIQYETAPDAPIKPDAEWAYWHRVGDGSTLGFLAGNFAYLVKSTATATFTLKLTGRPLLPRFNGQKSGICFTGFPMAGGANPLSQRLDFLFSLNSVLKKVPEIFFYDGGEFTDSTHKNPVQVRSSLFPNTTVVRGMAYWVSASTRTEYYGPLAVTASDLDGLDFGTNNIARVLRVKNVTDPTKGLDVTVTIASADSATPPTGQTASAGRVPMMLRQTDLDPVTFQPVYVPFSAPITRKLAPGEEVEINFYLSRGSLDPVAGKTYQSLLRVSDSLGISRVDVPVRASSTSFAGLWVGTSMINKVDQIVGTTATPKTSSPAGFTQRLIVHIDSSGKATLLQQVYLGTDTTETVAANQKKILTRSAYTNLTDAKFQNASRISCASLPLDLAVVGTGTAGRTGTVTFNAALSYQDATNPFVHPYHPAHDNRDAAFSAQRLASGVESYDITRSIKLEFLGADTQLSSDPAWGSTLIGGTYSEEITGLREIKRDPQSPSVPIKVSGAFVLRRISDIPTLTNSTP